MTRPRGLAAAIGVASSLAGAVTVFAHGGLSMDQDTCKLRVGPYVMHFTGYQPDRTAEREFCEDIPATGRTVIVLDYLDPKLRSVPVDVRIIRDVADQSDLDAITVYRKEPAVYEKGTLSIEHRFDEAGRFVGLVTVTESDQIAQVSRFPFSVGRTSARTWLVYGFFAVATVGLGAALFLYSTRRG
jgi:hypothetical protein